jgi:(5-formylfuran-3-yl)methyl phosphate synthase
MKLLVSVARAEEVRLAVEAGADIVDAKEPAFGALGAVSSEELTAIAAALSSARPLSVALGDATDERAVATAVRSAASMGASFVKLGFCGISSAAGARVLAGVAVAAARDVAKSEVILVAYADATRCSSLEPHDMLDVAADAGAHGVLLDTCRKDRGDLFSLISPANVERWVRRSQAAGMLAALAGSLDAAGVALAADIGADVAGVRGAACDGGREGRISAERVALLAAAF